MSRRTQPCRHCPGRTRHRDHRCSTCRNNPLAHLGAIGRAAYDATLSMEAAQQQLVAMLGKGPQQPDWLQLLGEVAYREHVAASLAAGSPFVKFSGSGA